MKTLLFLLLTITANAQDSGGIKKCGPLKFKFLDVVEVTNKNNFYFGCTGEVQSRTVDCDYYVTSVCDEANEYFIKEDLKLKKQGKRK